MGRLLLRCMLQCGLCSLVQKDGGPLIVVAAADTLFCDGLQVKPLAHQIIIHQ